MTSDNQERAAVKRPSATATFIALLIALASIPALGQLLAWFMRISFHPGETFGMVFLLVYQCLFFAGPALFYYARHKDRVPALRARAIDPLCAVLIILAAFASALSLSQLSSLWFLLLESWGLAVGSSAIAPPTTGSQLGIMLITTAIAPALMEEILFRGFLLPSLEIKGRKTAVLLSGLLFAMMHGRIEALPSHILLGCALAVLVLRTGSVFSSMLFHGAYNGSLIIVSYLLVQVEGASPEQASYTLADGIASLPTTLCLLAISALLVYVAGERGFKKQRHPLPAAEREALTPTAKVLLILCIATVLVYEINALLAMLPGTAA